MSALRVTLAGDWSRLKQLRSELLAHDAVVFAHGPDVDAVLLAAPEPAVPAAELAGVRAETAAPVVLVALHATEALLDAADTFGIVDVLVQPQPTDTVVFAVRKASRQARPAPETPALDGAIYTVFSPKGGTGKSVTACNLAASSAAHGKRTLLLDLDLQFGDTAIMLGLEPRKTLLDLVADPGALDAEKLAGYVTEHPSGLHVLPAPLRPEDAEHVSEERVAQLLDVARHVYEVIVVDTSPYFHGPMLATLDRSERLLLVCAPDVPTLKNLRLTLHTLELLSFPSEKTRVVLNRADPRVGLKAGEVGAVLGHRVDFQLPADPAVPLAVNRGLPAVTANRRSPFGQAFTRLADELLAPEEAPARRGRRLPSFKLAFGGH